MRCNEVLIILTNACDKSPFDRDCALYFLFFFLPQSGVLAARTTSPFNYQSGLGVASISDVFSKLGGGGGKGFGGWGRGGGGRDGFEVPAAVGTSSGDASNSITEDVIFLSVGVTSLTFSSIFSFLFHSLDRVICRFVTKLGTMRFVLSLS